MMLINRIRKFVLIALYVLGFTTFSYAQTLTSISEARTKIGSRIKVSGVVTTDGVLDGRLRYFQDPTGGLVVFEIGNPAIGALERGDSIIVSGKLTDFNGLLEVVGPDIVIEMIDKGKPLPNPISAIAADIIEENEAKLMRFEKITFENDGGKFSVKNFIFFDSLGNKGEMRVGSNHPLIGKDIPAGKSTLIGVLSQYISNTSNYQILPRDAEDLIVGFSILDFEQTDIQNRSISFEWLTNLRGSTGLRYREAGTEDFDTIYIENSQSTHAATIGGLRPATFYEMQAFSKLPNDETFTPITTFSTRSESNGNIKVYFNKPIQGDNADGVYLQNTFADTIAAYINRASTSIDVAVYNSNAGANTIIQALNNAKSRGVRVRYIADGSQSNTALTSLNSSIPVLKSNASAGIMHNKFVVIDAGSQNHSYVISSSCNWTSNGLNDDPNNMLIVQDQAVANAYQWEFQEMWGGTGSTPNLANIKFGAAKIKNTPEKFIVGGNPIELYFSPTDGANSAILEGLDNVNSDLRFSTLLITRSDIANKISDLHNNGWSVKGIIDDTTDILGSQFKFMKGDGVDVYLWQPSPLTGQFHHKYAIIDALKPESDPTVITGSHNWSTAAETTNDENTMVIHNSTVANLFLKEFRRRYLELTGNEDDVLLLIEDKILPISFYPNPTKGLIYLKTENQLPLKVSLVDFFGRTVFNTSLNNIENKTEVADISHLTNGVYLMQVVQDGRTSVYRILLNK